MSTERRIDDLIEAGWVVINSDFDSIAFHNWRLNAFVCLSDMLGPDHVYTRHFEDFVRQGSKTDLLAGGGILSAVKEQTAFNKWGSVQADGNVTLTPVSLTKYT